MRFTWQFHRFEFPGVERNDRDGIQFYHFGLDPGLLCFCFCWSILQRLGIEAAAKAIGDVRAKIRSLIPDLTD